MGWTSPGWVSMQLKSMVSAARRGGVPVFRRPRANPDCSAESWSSQVLPCQHNCGSRQQQAVRPDFKSRAIQSRETHIMQRLSQGFGGCSCKGVGCICRPP